MKRILVIDDETGFRLILEKVLSRAGYEVMGAENGITALELFRRQSADLVITDLVMPEKEGLETIVDLRALNPELKIIAMSGGGRNGPETYLDLAKVLGAAHVLAKPFGSPELLSAVQSLLAETSLSG